MELKFYTFNVIIRIIISIRRRNMFKKFLALSSVLLVSAFLPFSSNNLVSAKSTEEEKLGVDNLEEIEDSIIATYGSLENFEEEGTLIFDENGQAVFMMKENDSNALFNNELERNISRNMDLKTGDIAIVKESKYSTKDLVDLQEAIIEEIINYNDNLLKQNKLHVSLSLTNQQITVEHVEEIPQELKQKLVLKFGNDLVFEEKDSLIKVKQEKGRYDDWNNLGGGLGIKVQGQNSKGHSCSTGPIAKKGSDFYLLTAGHCLFNPGSMVYQFNSTVGKKQGYANDKGYDVGLVRVTNDNTLKGGRLATNGVLVKNHSSSGYDKSFNRTASVYEGMPVCKSGATTNTTCGKVTKKYDYFFDSKGNRVNVTQVKGSGSRYSAGGDSGAIVISNNSSAPGNNAVLGTHSAGDGVGVYGYFTRITDTMRVYGLDIHVSSTPQRIVY